VPSGNPTKKNNLRRLLCQEEEEAVVKNHQSVDWYAYFKSIRQQCPWSYVAWLQGLIDIVSWDSAKVLEPLGKYQARMYVLDYPDNIVEAMAEELDSNDKDCEWLFSYPGYGDYATPVAVLIQQHRHELAKIRQSLDAKIKEQ
jgi:hypothetical protein